MVERLLALGVPISYSIGISAKNLNIDYLLMYYNKIHLLFIKSQGMHML